MPSNSTCIFISCIIFVSTLLCLVPESTAQQCQPFDPLYTPASREVCPPFLHDLVSLTNSTSIAKGCDIFYIWSPYSFLYSQGLIDEAFNTSELWMVKAIRPITPIMCYQHLVSLTCNSAFQPCENLFISELNQTGI